MIPLSLLDGSYSAPASADDLEGVLNFLSFTETYTLSCGNGHRDGHRSGPSTYPSLVRRSPKDTVSKCAFVFEAGLLRSILERFNKYAIVADARLVKAS